MKTVTVKILNVPDGYNDVSADIVRNTSIRLHGLYRGEPLDKTFVMGDDAEYDSWNLSYTGKILGITDKSVTIGPDHHDKNKRLRLVTFLWRNYKFDAEETREFNREEAMCH